MDFINFPIFLISILLVVSVLTSLVSSKANIPLILVFLCIGLLIGEGGLSLVTGFHQPKIAFFIGSVALALILFDNGFQTSLKSYRQNVVPSLLLSTVGVFLTTLFFAPIAYYFLDFSFVQSFLLASIISSTDSAAVFFLLRMGGVSVRDKIKSTLEVESGTNDPMAIFLTFSCLGFLINPTMSLGGYIGLTFIQQMGIGLLAGLGMSVVVHRVINRVNLDIALYPVFLIAMVLIGFSMTNIFGGSGFLALYVAGLLLGNSKIKGYYQILRFQKTLAWMCQIIIFLSLGLFANFRHFSQLVTPALVLGTSLIFIARPLAIFLCLAPFKYTFKEKAFISFVGLRGATSILLALAPLAMQLDKSELIFNLIFLMVLLSLAVQGFYIIPFSKICKVILPIYEKPADKVEIDLPGLEDSSLITYILKADSPVLKGEKIPKWAWPILVKRNGVSFNGANIKEFQEKDQVYVFSNSEKTVEVLDHLFSAGTVLIRPSELGDFVLRPETKLIDLSFLYGIKVEKKMEKETLGKLLEKNFSNLEVGDRFALDHVELIVRKIVAGKIEEIGLDLDPNKSQKTFRRFWKRR